MINVHDDVTNILSWTAVIILSISYWFQIYKIHVHKEVRDLSMTYHVFLAIGFGILAFTAWQEHSLIFLVKQIATTFPVIIIIVQILIHKRDRWHDNNDLFCQSCNQELEPKWNNCAYCGVKKPGEQKLLKTL